MKRLTPRLGVYLFLDVLLLIICLRHLPSVFQRPGVPFKPVDRDGRVVIGTVSGGDAASGIIPGDRLIEWDGVQVPLPEAVEFLADQASIGDLVPVILERNGSRMSIDLFLVPYYESPRFILISIIVGLIIWATALLIVWNAPPGGSAMALHWTMIAFAVTILLTPGAISSDSVMSFVERGLFFFAYQGVVSLFFLFTVLYPSRRAGVATAILSQVPALVLACGLSALQLADLAEGSLARFQAFQVLFDLFHVSLFAYTGGAVARVVLSLGGATRREDRRRLQWIAWGLAIGASPFLFLHILPQIVFSTYIIAEEYATIFFLVIPFSFAMSFLKYRFLDIELLINRSIVYTVLSLFLIIVFSLVFFLVTTAFGSLMKFEEYAALSLIALLFALSFSRIRARVQLLVDETLFAARADFRSAVRNLSSDLHRVLTSDGVYKSLGDRLFALIPSRTLAVYRLSNGELHLAHRRGEQIPERLALIPAERAALTETPVAAFPNALESPLPGMSPGATQWLQRTGSSMSASLTDEQGNLIGAVVLSPKTERDRFREEEVDLLQTACAQASEALGRLVLQERMFLEQQENQRLKEMSDLKSYFVSSVSHELRTPLAAIRMFAEMLRLGRRSGGRRQREYLRIIEGESARLGRLIGNVLDFSRIERGVKEYDLRPINIRTVVQRAVAALRYEFKAARGTLAVTVGRNVPRTIQADEDAVEQLLLNLLSNALKYSVGKKRADLAVRRSGGHLRITVSDSGIGIARNELPLIFEKFHRAREGRPREIGGTGLGLPIVKHIVESHHGTISVKSTVGKGSTFTVNVPIHLTQLRRPDES